MSLHLSFKGTLTACSIPVAFVDEWITATDIVRDSPGLREAFEARGCVECCTTLIAALRNARPIHDA